ncbi:hypothetical protein D3C87_1256240 [compost metagenome]
MSAQALGIGQGDQHVASLRLVGVQPLGNAAVAFLLGVKNDVQHGGRGQLLFHAFLHELQLGLAAHAGRAARGGVGRGGRRRGGAWSRILELPEPQAGAGGGQQGDGQAGVETQRALARGFGFGRRGQGFGLRRGGGRRHRCFDDFRRRGFGGLGRRQLARCRARRGLAGGRGRHQFAGYLQDLARHILARAAHAQHRPVGGIHRFQQGVDNVLAHDRCQVIALPLQAGDLEPVRIAAPAAVGLQVAHVLVALDRKVQVFFRSGPLLDHQGGLAGKVRAQRT